MADTVVPGGGFDPQLLNRYSYVRNNPLIYVDPSGHHLGGYNGPNHNGKEDGYDDFGYDLNDDRVHVDEGKSRYEPSDSEKEARSKHTKWMTEEHFVSTARGSYVYETYTVFHGGWSVTSRSSMKVKTFYNRSYGDVFRDQMVANGQQTIGYMNGNYVQNQFKYFNYAATASWTDIMSDLYVSGMYEFADLIGHNGFYSSPSGMELWGDVSSSFWGSSKPGYVFANAPVINGLRETAVEIHNIAEHVSRIKLKK